MIGAGLQVDVLANPIQDGAQVMHDDLPVHLHWAEALRLQA